MTPALRACFPWIFVLIWSTGFIVARFGMPHAEPLTFLSMRYSLAVLVLLPIALLRGAAWPSPSLLPKVALAGLLLQAGYLGGVWAAVKLGMGAGLVALIMGLQPIITATLLMLAQHQIGGRQWAGLFLGLVGVGLVVWARLSLAGLSMLSLVFAAVALVSITGGTLYQKKACPSFDLRTGAIVQYSASLLVTLPLALLLETGQVDWAPEMVGALVWSVLALSIGAVFLLFVMIREGAATQVTSLLYLTPPTTAIMAWGLFGEPVTLLTILGTLTAVAGVWLVVRHRHGLTSSAASPPSIPPVDSPPAPHTKGQT